MRTLRLLLIALMLTAVDGDVSPAQAVQATRASVETARERHQRAERERAKALGHRLSLEALPLVTSASDTTPTARRNLESALALRQTLTEQLDRIIDERDDRRALQAARRLSDAAKRQEKGGVDLAARNWAYSAEPAPEERSDYSTTLGIAWVDGDAGGVSIELQTNAPTSLAASLTQNAFGTTVTDFLRNGVALGLSLPTSGEARIATAPSISFGTRKVRDVFEFTPALSMTQRDASDSTIPASVTSADTAKAWSTPVIGVAFKALPDGPIVSDAVLTLQYQLPLYFPGDATTALGALFSDRRSEFVRGGDGRWIIAVHLLLGNRASSQPPTR